MYRLKENLECQQILQPFHSKLSLYPYPLRNPGPKNGSLPWNHTPAPIGLRIHHVSSRSHDPSSTVTLPFQVVASQLIRFKVPVTETSLDRSSTLSLTMFRFSCPSVLGPHDSGRDNYSQRLVQLEGYYGVDGVYFEPTFTLLEIPEKVEIMVYTEI